MNLVLIGGSTLEVYKSLNKQRSSINSPALSSETNPNDIQYTLVVVFTAVIGKKEMSRPKNRILPVLFIEEFFWLRLCKNLNHHETKKFFIAF